MVPRGEVPDRFEAPWEPRLMVRQATGAYSPQIQAEKSQKKYKHENIIEIAHKIKSRIFSL